MGRKKQSDKPAGVASPPTTSSRKPNKSQRVPVQTVTRTASSRETRAVLADSFASSRGPTASREDLTQPTLTVKTSASSPSLSPSTSTITALNSPLNGSTVIPSASPALAAPAAATTADERTPPRTTARAGAAHVRPATHVTKDMPLSLRTAARATTSASARAPAAPARAWHARPVVGVPRAATPSSQRSVPSPGPSASTSTASPSPSPSPRQELRARARAAGSGGRRDAGSQAARSPASSSPSAGTTPGTGSAASTKPVPTPALPSTAASASTTVFKQPPPPPVPILRIAVEKEQEVAATARRGEDLDDTSDYGSETGSAAFELLLRSEHVYSPVSSHHTVGSPRGLGSTLGGGVSVGSHLSSALASPAAASALSHQHRPPRRQEGEPGPRSSGFAGAARASAEGTDGQALPPRAKPLTTRLTATKKPPLTRPGRLRDPADDAFTSAMSEAGPSSSNDRTTSPPTVPMLGHTGASPTERRELGSSGGGGAADGGMGDGADPGRGTAPGRTRRRTSMVSVHPPTEDELARGGSGGVGGGPLFAAVSAPVSPLADGAVPHSSSGGGLSAHHAAPLTAGTSPEAVDALRPRSAGAHSPVLAHSGSSVLLLSASPVPILASPSAAGDGVPVVPSLQSGFRNLRQSLQTSDFNFNNGSFGDLRTPTYTPGYSPGGAGGGPLPSAHSTRSARSARSARSGRIHRTSSNAAPLNLQQLFADTPEEFIIPRGRFSLAADSERCVLGRGAYGEVLRGELYPPTVDSGRLGMSVDGADSAMASKLHSPLLRHASETPVDFNSTNSLVLLPSHGAAGGGGGGGTSSTHPTPRTSRVHMQPYTPQTASFYSESKATALNDSQGDNLDAVLHALRATPSQRGARVPTDSYGSGMNNSISHSNLLAASVDREYSMPAHSPRVSPHQRRISVPWASPPKSPSPSSARVGTEGDPALRPQHSGVPASCVISRRGGEEGEAGFSGRRDAHTAGTTSSASSSSFAVFGAGSKGDPFDVFVDPYPSPEDPALLMPLGHGSGGDDASGDGGGGPHDPKRPTMVPPNNAGSDPNLYSTHDAACRAAVLAAEQPSRESQPSRSSTTPDLVPGQQSGSENSTSADPESVLQASSHPLHDGSLRPEGSPRDGDHTALAAAIAAVTAKHTDPSSVNAVSLVPVTCLTTASLILSTPSEDLSPKAPTTDAPAASRPLKPAALMSTEATVSLNSVASTASVLDLEADAETHRNASVSGAGHVAAHAVPKMDPHHDAHDEDEDEDDESTAPWRTGEGTPLHVVGQFSSSNSAFLDAGGSGSPPSPNGERRRRRGGAAVPLSHQLSVPHGLHGQPLSQPASPLDLACTTRQDLAPQPPSPSSSQPSPSFLRADHRLSATMAPAQTPPPTASSPRTPSNPAKDAASPESHGAKKSTEGGPAAAFYAAIAQQSDPRMLQPFGDDDDDDDDDVVSTDGESVSGVDRGRRDRLTRGSFDDPEGRPAGGGESPAAPQSGASIPAIFSFTSFGASDDQVRLSSGDLPPRSNSSSHAHISPNRPFPNVAGASAEPTLPLRGVYTGTLPSSSSLQSAYGKSVLSSATVHGSSGSGGGGGEMGELMALTGLSILLDTTTMTDGNGGTMRSTVSSLMPERLVPALPTHPGLHTTAADSSLTAASAQGRADEDEDDLLPPPTSPPHGAPPPRPLGTLQPHVRTGSTGHMGHGSGGSGGSRFALERSGDFMPLDATVSSLGEAVARGTIPFRPVAVKVVAKADLCRPNFFQAFRNEMLMSSQLHHAGLVNVFGLSEDNTSIYFVMDLAENGTLSDYLQRFGVEDTRMMAPNFMADLVLALEYLRDGRQHLYKRPLPPPPPPGQPSSATTPHSSRDRLLTRGYISRPPPSVESASLGATFVLSDDADTPTPGPPIADDPRTPPLATPPVVPPLAAVGSLAEVVEDNRTARSSHSAASGSATARRSTAGGPATPHPPPSARPPPLRPPSSSEKEHVATTAATADGHDPDEGHEEETEMQSGSGSTLPLPERLAESIVVHRDIKPDNMLMTWDYHIKLGDFGNACFLGDEEANRYGGTPAYMAPEVVRQSAAGPYSDLWALGCTLYELLEGTRLFQGKTDYLVLDKVKKFDPEALVFPSDAAPPDGPDGTAPNALLSTRPPPALHAQAELLPTDHSNLLVSLRSLSSAESAPQSPASSSMSSAASASGRAAEQAVDQTRLRGIMKHGHDLVRQLVRPNPAERLGAEGTGGFAALKNHPFFEGIDWENVGDIPNITTHNTDYTNELSEFILEEERLVYCSPVVLLAEAASSASPPPGGLPGATGQRSRGQWTPHTVGAGAVPSPSAAATTQLLALTEGPTDYRLFIVDPETESIRTTFPWSPAVRVNVVDANVFQVISRPIVWSGEAGSTSGGSSGSGVRRLNSLPHTGSATADTATGAGTGASSAWASLGPSQVATYRVSNGRADLWGVKVNRCVDKAFGFHHGSSGGTSTGAHRYARASSKFNGASTTANSFSTASHPPTLNFSTLTSSRSSQQTLLSRLRQTPRMSARCEAGSPRPGSTTTSVHTPGHHTSPHTSAITVTVASTSREARLPSQMTSGGLHGGAAREEEPLN